MESKIEYCAFGAMVPWRFGEILEKTENYVKIKPEFGRPEYWDRSYVSIFGTSKEAINETLKWIKDGEADR